MIALVEAKPGQGKSVYATYRIVQRLLTSRDLIIATNIPLTLPPKFRDKYGHRLVHVENWGDIKRVMLSQVEHQSMGKSKEQSMLFVLDELSLLLDANNWENLPMQVKYLLRQHRKYGVDILGFSQSVRDIDVKYRRLMQRLFTIQKIFVWKFIYPFGLFLLREWDSDDVDLEKRERVPLPLITYPPEFVYADKAILNMSDSWNVFTIPDHITKVVEHVEVVCTLHGSGCEGLHRKITHV